MALVNWLLLVSGLLVASTGLYLYGTYPFLALPTPWGPWPFYLLLPGAFLLGLGVGGLYALGLAWAGRRERAAAWRRVRALEREVAELKKARIEEIPRIPDRDLEA